MELTSENTAIVVDSTADFPEAAERFANWRVVPLYLQFGDESLRDYVDLQPEEFYARLREAAQLPTTSQPTPGDFAAAYESLGEYERVLSFHISSKLSGTFESARAGAAELGDRVRLYDSRSASAAVAMLALAAQRRLEAGTTAAEIDGLVERFRREAGLLFTVETLEYLARGGRIGKARATAGALLHIKPILTIGEGEVVQLARVRGSAKALAELARRFTGATRDEPALRVGIAHADAPERARALSKMVASERPAAQVEIVTSLGPVVGTHAGPGTMGLFWFRD